MKLTIIEDVKKLTIEEVMNDNIFTLRVMETGLTGHQLFRVTLEDIVSCSEKPDTLIVRIDN